jgi:hypothetical protein
MINLELEPQTAVHVLQALVDAQNGYTYEEHCVPSRIVQIREVIGKIDAALEEAMND